jgi:hypothetical protein
MDELLPDKKLLEIESRHLLSSPWKFPINTTASLASRLPRTAFRLV